MKPHLLIVDDDREFQALLRRTLSPHYEIATATDRTSAVDAFRATKPPVVLLDLGLPPTRGAAAESLGTLADLLAVDSQSRVVVLGQPGEKEAARRAAGAGAYDHLTRPVDLEDLKLALRRALHVNRLERELRELRARTQLDAFDGMVGNCPAMQTVFETIRKVATTEAPALITGERGTGKELTARVIHQLSLRSTAPFVTLDCGALPAAMIEAELFGREEAGPGVRKGKLELADGGTLCLNEIGSLPGEAQAKLIRFLQDQSLQRIGGRQGVPVDTRVLAAGSPGLAQLLTSGRFRDDLYYHLGIVQLTLPPLRDRGEDIVLLANYFLTTFTGGEGRRALGFTPDALQTMRHYPWPGNVRELQSRVRRAAIMCDGPLISPTDLELGPLDALIMLEGGTLRDARERVEREMVRQALRRNSGRITAAAAELGISRPTLYDLIQKLQVEH